MFLGGWSLGLPWELTDLFAGMMGDVGYILGNVVNVGVFIFKCWFLVFIMMWVRWTLPRLRIDQVMMTCLKYILPISCFLLVGVCLWRLVVPELVQQYFRFAMMALVLVLIGVVIKQWFTWSQALPVTAMPGMSRTMGVPGFHGPGFHGMKKT
jgi:NADH-quinone oxidoreductase subunit H